MLKDHLKMNAIHTVQNNLQRRIFIPVLMHQNHPFDSTAKKVKRNFVHSWKGQGC